MAEQKKYGSAIGAVAGGFFGGPVGASIGSTLGGLLDSGGSSGPSQTELMLKDVFDQYNALSVPDLESQYINPEAYSLQGLLDPSMEEALLLSQRDALQDIQLDPRLKNTQMDSLKMLEEISKGGLTPTDRAALNSIRRQTQSDVSAQLNSMLQQQDQRGLGSSDASLALRANAAQSAANRQSQEMDRQQAMAFERALNATQQAGNLAGNIEQSDYNRQANLANALNARESANLNQRTGTQTRNIDRFNQAQQSNLSARQGIANMNTAGRNQAQQVNKGLIQTQYDNKLKRLGGMSSAATGGAASLQKEDQARRDAQGSFNEGVLDLATNFFKDKG